MKNNSSSPRRRHRFHAVRSGTIHASQGVAHAYAAFYHRLASGTAAQRQKAGEFRDMVLSMKEEPA